MISSQNNNREDSMRDRDPRDRERSTTPMGKGSNSNSNSKMRNSYNRSVVSQKDLQNIDSNLEQINRDLLKRYKEKIMELEQVVDDQATQIQEKDGYINNLKDQIIYLQKENMQINMKMSQYSENGNNFNNNSGGNHVNSTRQSTHYNNNPKNNNYNNYN